MKQYKIYGKFEGYVSITVEAESAEDAVEKAYGEFGGINNYVGNGGYDKLIGVSGKNESIDVGEEINWEQPDEGDDQK